MAEVGTTQAHPVPSSDNHPRDVEHGRDEFLTKLRDVASRTLRAAGPRYAPSLDPGAPNLAIRPLEQAAHALAQGTAFAERARQLVGVVQSAHERDEHFADRLFSRRTVDLRRLVADLEGLVSVQGVRPRRHGMQGLRRHVRSIGDLLSSANEAARARLSALEVEKPDLETEAEQRARSDERTRAQSELGSIRRLWDALDEVADFANGTEGHLLAEKSAVLLLGAWGTGKTHFLCDFALQTISDGTPTLVVLASALRTDVPPLDALAELTGLAPSGAALADLLDTTAKGVGRRALIMIDAINESDREVWRRNLPNLLREIDRRENVGLIVSCRTPFDSSIVTDAILNKIVRLHHPGFEEQEFDAQLEFFRYYGLPALHVPLLTSEFSRPLFLRLMCEGIKDLSRRSQKSHLRDLASGQKGMTYVLERFV
jgi:hypothetical protein